MEKTVKKVCLVLLLTVIGFSGLKGSELQLASSGLRLTALNEVLNSGAHTTVPLDIANEIAEFAGVRHYSIRVLPTQKQELDLLADFFMVAINILRTPTVLNRFFNQQPIPIKDETTDKVKAYISDCELMRDPSSKSENKTAIQQIKDGRYKDEKFFIFASNSLYIFNEENITQPLMTIKLGPGDEFFLNKIDPITKRNTKYLITLSGTGYSKKIELEELTPLEHKLRQKKHQQRKKKIALFTAWGTVAAWVCSKLISSWWR